MMMIVHITCTSNKQCIYNTLFLPSWLTNSHASHLIPSAYKPCSKSRVSTPASVHRVFCNLSWPKITATPNGVLPWESEECRLAPALTRSSAFFTSPLRAAQCRGVHPKLSWTSFGALALRRAAVLDRATQNGVMESSISLQVASFGRGSELKERSYVMRFLAPYKAVQNGSLHCVYSLGAHATINKTCSDIDTILYKNSEKRTSKLSARNIQ